MQLPRSTREKAQALMSRLQLFNGLGAGFAFGEVIILLALFYGATDFQMGWIFIGIHLAGLGNFVAPILFRGRDNTTIWLVCWWGRTILGLGYLLLPFLHEGASRVWGLIAIYYAYMGMRSIGAATYLPVVKAITTERERPMIVADVFQKLSLSLVVVAIVSYLFFRIQIFPTDLGNYHAILVLGFVFGCITCVLIARMPPTGAMGSHGMNGLKDMFTQIVATPLMRQMLQLSFLQTAVLILANYMVNFMKNTLDMDADGIFLLTSIGLIGSTIAGQGIKLIKNRISKWALLFGTHALIGCACVAFAFGAILKDSVFMWFITIPVVAIFVGRWASVTVLSQLQADSLPDEKGFLTSLIYQLSAVFASLMSVAFIYLMDRLDIHTWHQDVPYTHEYSLIFAAAAVVCMIVCLMSFRVKSVGGTLRELSLIRPSNFTSLYRLAKIENDDDQPKFHALEGLLASGNQISHQLLHEYLSSSDTRKRYVAYRSLTQEPNTSVYKLVLNEAITPRAPLRYDAITALGFIGVKDAVEHLVPLLTDPDESVRAVSLKSLLRLGWNESDATILDHYQMLWHSHRHLDIVIGCVAAEKHMALESIFAFELEQQPADQWLRSLSLYLGESYGRRDAIIDIMDSEQQSPGKGITLIYDYLEEQCPKGLDKQQIPHWLRENDMTSLNRHLHELGWPSAWQAYDTCSALAIIYLGALKQMHP